MYTLVVYFKKSGELPLNAFELVRPAFSIAKFPMGEWIYFSAN